VAMAPAQDVRFSAGKIAVAFWSPDRRLVVIRVRASGRTEYTMAAGEAERGVARFAAPSGYNWHVMSGSLLSKYTPLHPVAVATIEPQAVSPTAPVEALTPSPPATTG
jgi:hypothetical protein